MATQSRQYENSSQRSKNGEAQQIANGLGWFSIGLGLAEIIAPGAMANLIGVRDHKKTRTVMRTYGLREIAAGIGILSTSNPSGWLWARVAGDVLDLSSLGKAMTSSRTERGKAGSSAAAVLGVTALDVYCALKMSSTSENGRTEQAHKPRITSAIIIDRSAEEIYRFWRDFTHLPQIFRQLESVQTLEGNRSHWSLKTGMGHAIEWDAEITDDQPNSRIAWQSNSSTARHSGSIRFEPATGGRGTKVTVQIEVGGFGANLAKFFGAVPEQMVGVALHNLKQILETGEVVNSDASIHPGMHPGQPPEEYHAPNQAMQHAASM